MNLIDTAEIPPQVMTRDMGDETVILDLSSGTYFSLNPVGARCWELLRQGLTLGQACETLQSEYEVEPERLVSDLTRLTTELVERSLLKVRPAGR